MTSRALCPVCFTHPRQAHAARCFDCDPRNVGKAPPPPEPERTMPPLIFPAAVDDDPDECP